MARRALRLLGLLAGTAPGAAAAAAAAVVAQLPGATVAVSENPVKGTQVVISWPAASGGSRVSIFSFAGERVASAAVAAGQHEYAWDLTIAGHRAPNGAYIVVVETGGQVHRRRLFVTRP